MGNFGFGIPFGRKRYELVLSWHREEEVSRKESEESVLRNTEKDLRKRLCSGDDIASGRNVIEGTVRAWGLEFGTICRSVFRSTVFREAERLIRTRSLIPSIKLANLYLLLKYYVPKLSQQGSVVEFGTYRGGSLMFMALVSRSLGLKHQFYGFDSFTGMPVTDQRIDLHKTGDFSDVSFEDVQSFRDKLRLDNVHLVQGLFEETAQETLKKVGPVVMAHIDCDIYSSVSYTYETLKEFMVPGGYIVFDDPLAGSCLGALQAVEDHLVRRDKLSAEQAYPHLVFRYRPL